MECCRNNNIDVAKGIGIFLLVLSHTHFSGYGVAVINMAHMPLFFFFSGYCFKEKYLDNFRTFLNQRIKGLYIPMVKWGLFFLLLHNLFFKLNIYNEYFGFHGETSHFLSFEEILRYALILITTMNSNSLLLGGYWFLKALFLSSLISYMLIKILKHKVIYAIPVLIVSCIIMTADNMPYLIVRLYGRCSLASAVFLSGYLYKKSGLKYEEKPVFLIPISLILVFVGGFYYPMRMGDPRGIPLNYVLYYITSLLGVLLIYSISKQIRDGSLLDKFFIFVGKNTMTVLTWHLLCFKPVSYIIINIYNYPLIHLAEFPVIEERVIHGWWMFYLLCGFSIPLATKYALTALCKNVSIRIWR